MRRSNRLSRSAGFTLVEALISLAILGVMGVAFTSSMRSMANLTHSGNARSTLQRSAAEALETILTDLRRSGFVNQGGLDYPYLFENGDAKDGFEAHAHPVPAGEAVDGDYDWQAGLTREIVLLLPDDADNDGEPDVVDGVLVFSDDEISYILTQDVRGQQVLERRVNAGSPKNMATGVERVIFEDSEDTGFAIPLDAIRVRIYFRVRDEAGQEVRYSTEGTARLRNGLGPEEIE